MVTEIKKMDYSKRIKLFIPKSQLKKLQRGRKAHIVSNYQWYELIPRELTTVLVDGKKFRATPKQLKQIRDLVRGN